MKRARLLAVMISRLRPSWPRCRPPSLPPRHPNRPSLPRARRSGSDATPSSRSTSRRRRSRVSRTCRWGDEAQAGVLRAGGARGKRRRQAPAHGPEGRLLGGLQVRGRGLRDGPAARPRHGAGHRGAPGGERPRLGPALVEGCRLLKDVDQKACRGRSSGRSRSAASGSSTTSWPTSTATPATCWSMASGTSSSSTTRGLRVRPDAVREGDDADRPGDVRALKGLDEAGLMERIRPWVLGDGPVRGILKRRDRIVARFEKLARERGEAVVFPF